ncbi:MAG: CheR family methyltransferase [Methyloligellaceae bacterium]
MTPQDFDYFKSLLKERSGLILSDDKGYLIESRLGPIVKKANLESITALVEELKKAGSEDLRNQVTEAMTTNESFFFRDKLPFNHFKEAMLPHILETRKLKRSFRVWCAASSTGQEPYSLAITLQEMGDQIQGWRPEIVATDLSSEVLEKAQSGLYSQFEVQRGLAAPLLVKYFEQVGSLWQISSTIRGMVQYRQYNLLDSFVPLGTFDIVFCRNVLIYFDQKTKIDVLNRIAAQTAPDGFLVLGAAETIVGLTDAFVPVEGRRGMFQKATAENAGILKNSAVG